MSKKYKIAKIEAEVGFIFVGFRQSGTLDLYIQCEHFKFWEKIFLTIYYFWIFFWLDSVDIDKFWFDFSSSHRFSLSVFFSFCRLECLGSIKLWCGSGSWIRTGKKWIRIQDILDLMNFFNKNNFLIFYFIFFAYLYSKTWWTIQKGEHFYNIFFQKFKVGFQE